MPRLCLSSEGRDIDRRKVRLILITPFHSVAKNHSFYERMRLTTYFFIPPCVYMVRRSRSRIKGLYIFNCGKMIARKFVAQWVNTVVSGILMAVGFVTECAFAIPLELFDQRLEVLCGTEGDCRRALRSRTTLGSYLGISLRGEGRSYGSLMVEKGELTVKATGSTLRGVYLSWDSDTYPEQLSSSGLGCFDLQQDGASAIILQDFEVKGVCGAATDGSGCSVLVENRVYDSSDPTGQTYSATLLKIPDAKDKSDLLVPFSNLIRKGPRGSARLSCAGAITLLIQPIGYSQFELSIGTIYTNSQHGLTPVPTKAISASTQPAASATPIDVSTAAISNTPLSGAVGTDAVGRTTLSVETPSESSKMIFTPAPLEQYRASSVPTVKPKPSGVTDTALVSPTVGAPAKADVPMPPRHEEEAVYGEVVR